MLLRLKEYLDKYRYSIFIALTLITSMIAILFISYLQINDYKGIIEQEKNQIYMISTDELDNEEKAALILKGETKQDLINKGKEILEKDGFNDKYQTVFELRLKEYRKQIILKNSSIYMLIVVSVFMTINLVKKKNAENVDYINGLIIKLYGGNYDLNLCDYNENVNSKLYNTLNSFQRKLKLNEIKLNNEKEEVKSIVTNISHQLKTPIASVKMCYSLMNDDSLDSSEKREFMSRLGDEIKHLENLTLSLLNISKMETGIISINKKNQNIFDTIIDAVNAVYMKAQEKEICIELEEKDISQIENLKLPHDKKWTREAIANVLENAVKYSNSGTKINMRIFKMVNFLRIEIQDEGIGIPKEDYNNIFKRFYRGTSDVVQNTEGSGVGLFLTRSILENQGGSISVTSSKTINKRGSTFVLQLSLE